jgi:hypothetical protein
MAWQDQLLAEVTYVLRPGGIYTGMDKLLDLRCIGERVLSLLLASCEIALHDWREVGSGNVLRPVSVN